MRPLRAHAAGASWLVFTLAVTAAFARLAAHNLANYRPFSNDEGELMAVGYKLATRGVLGSDMYVGFFGGDQHHFETLPLQHILQALAFNLVGPGVGQARWISVLAAVATIWLVGWLAYHWYGLGTAILSEGLLVAWPSNLTAASDSLPLLGVARTARYDILAVALIWAAIAALDAALRRPTPIKGFALGICTGLAALTQFFGAFVLPLVAISWLRPGDRGKCAVPWIVTGASVVLLPYALYAALNFQDLRGQLTVFGNRGDFLSPSFYASNVLGEPARYAHLIQSPSISPWLLVVGVLPAYIYVARRSRKPEATGDRLLLASLITFAGLLLLLDSTKVALYAILLLPSISIAIAAAWAALLAVAWRASRRWPRLLVGATSTCLLIVVGLESVRAYQADFDAASAVTSYAALGQTIDAALAPGATVVGPERYWWALRAHPYLSLRSIWWRWIVAAATSQQTPQLADWVVGSDADVLIVNINVRADIEAFGEPLQAQFWSFIQDCTELVAVIPNPNYFDTEIYAVVHPPPSDECHPEPSLRGEGSRPYARSFVVPPQDDSTVS